MSDFLTTLAARSLGLASVMQPAIASLFSPGMVVNDDYEGWEQTKEGENFVSSSLYELATPNLPAISRLPLSQISADAPELQQSIESNNIEFNNDIFQKNISPTQFTQSISEPSIENAIASNNQDLESLNFQGLAKSLQSQQEEFTINSVQSNLDISNTTESFATQPIQNYESQSPSTPTFNQETPQSLWYRFCL
jgi:hypothetical protein